MSGSWRRSEERDAACRRSGAESVRSRDPVLVGGRVAAIVLDDDAARRRPGRRGAARRSDARSRQVGAVRRIDEHPSEAGRDPDAERRDARHRRRPVARPCDAELGEVAAQDVERGARLVDERRRARRRARAPRSRARPSRRTGRATCAPGDRWSEDREQRLADLLRGGTGRRPRRGPQDAPAEAARDDAHDDRITRRASREPDCCELRSSRLGKPRAAAANRVLRYGGPHGGVLRAALRSRHLGLARLAVACSTVRCPRPGRQGRAARGRPRVDLRRSSHDQVASHLGGAARAAAPARRARRRSSCATRSRPRRRSSASSTPARSRCRCPSWRRADDVRTTSITPARCSPSSTVDLEPLVDRGPRPRRRAARGALRRRRARRRARLPRGGRGRGRGAAGDGDAARRRLPAPLLGRHGPCPSCARVPHRHGTPMAA